MYVLESDFLELFSPRNFGKWAKSRFFKFIDKFSHYVLLNIFYNEN